jgi:hypothetical protein
LDPQNRTSFQNDGSTQSVSGDQNKISSGTVSGNITFLAIASIFDIFSEEASRRNRFSGALGWGEITDLYPADNY